MVVVVVQEDSVELLECELVDVTVGEAVEYVLDEFIEVTVKLVREPSDLVGVDAVILLVVAVIP